MDTTTQATYLFIFGAAADTPHEQYVISLGTPIVRYRPWKFRTEAELEHHLSTPAITGTWHVRVPGYRIILKIEYLSSLPGQHTWRGIPMNKVEDWSWLRSETLQAAQFYLINKILPNAPKFNRYKEQ